MAQPTTSIFLNSTTPSAPAGRKNVVFQTDNATPQQSVTAYVADAPVENETPSGAINGSNVIFALANTPNPVTSLKLYLSGLRQRYGTDFTLSGATITMAVAPESTENLIADYRY